MNYISIGFALFVLLCLIVYYLFPKDKRWYILLIASILFYVSYSFKYTIFIAITIFVSYFIAHQLPSASIRKKKLLLGGGVSAFVLLLFFLKFYTWGTGLIEILIKYLGMSFHFPAMNLLLPIGISFYTMQVIAYMVDVYKNKITPEDNLLKYSLFISYFPIIIQGPISRYEQLSPELIKGHDFNYDKILFNLQLIGWGILKKLVIADSLALYVDTVFTSPSDYYGFILYIGMIFYSIQLYMDFSGCVDICRGVSGMFGVHLISNFKQPYFSKSIKEFWNRWHLSLSRWLKDYIYIPLGGNKHGKIRKYINIIIVFLVSGLWHGCGFAFIVWGLLHGGYQIIGDSFVDIKSKIKKILYIKEDSLSEHIYKVLITFHLIAFAWIFFRSDGLMNAFKYIQHMIFYFNPWVLLNDSLYTLGLSLNRFQVILPLVMIVFIVEYFQFKRDYQLRKRINEMHIFIRWAIYISLILIIVVYGIYGSGYNASDFIYGGF